MPQCAACLHEIPSGGRYCPACGAAIANAAGEATGPYRPAQERLAAASPAHQLGAARFAPGQLLAGRYRIVALLGRGGMGEVYRADDLTLGQSVALKFLPKHLVFDPDRLARFRGEVRIARQISHPNVCRVYDIAEHDGQPFLTMEYVDGEDLATLLKKVGRLPEERGIEIARQLCLGLAAAHERDVLHRDLKPANIMLDGRGQVRILDFGLAVAADQATDARSGTPLYQAPEQIAGKEVSVRSDLYALGLLLYELFTGKRAYADVRRDTPPSKPSSHVAALNPAVERVILRCLEPDPKDRPRSVYEALAGLPGGDPLAAALAAGEMPSPQLVADAPIEGTLRALVAGALLAVTLGGLLLMAWLGDQFKAYRHMPLPAPANLDEYARELIGKLGYTDQPADFGGGFKNNVPYLQHMVREGHWTDEQAHLSVARPAPIAYWYRQSPRPLVPGQFADRFRSQELQLWMDNPPHDVPGMVMVHLDMKRRLVGLFAVPDPNADPPPKPMSCEDLLRIAELDGPGVMRPAKDASPTTPVFADRTVVWEGNYPERPDIAIRVEAGTYRGRPVYFRIRHPAWDTAAATSAANWRPSFNSPVFILASAVEIGVFVTLTILAVRNLRRGRGDARGAVRLAGAVLVLALLGWLLAGRHGDLLPLQFARFMQNFGSALAAAAVLAITYLALEPLMRQRCPHRLTALARLLDGRWRDPLVGRDVLIGVALGIIAVADTAAFPFGITGDGPIVLDSLCFTRPIWYFTLAASVSIGIGWFLMSVFVVFSLIVRRDWIAALLLAALIVVVLVVPTWFAIGSEWVVPGAVFRVAVLIFLLLRVGVLALIVWSFVALMTQFLPLTLDPEAWYFGASLARMLPIAGLAVYGYLVSLGGRSLLKGWLGDE